MLVSQLLFQLINSFQIKLELFVRQFKAGSLDHFPTCRQMTENSGEMIDFSGHATHMPTATSLLQAEFAARFIDFRTKNVQCTLYNLFNQSFAVDIDSLETVFRWKSLIYNRHRLFS